MCTNGAGGTQRCGDDGAYGVCECASVGPDMGGADLGPATDSGVPRDLGIATDLGSAIDMGVARDLGPGGDSGSMHCLLASTCNDNDMCTTDDCVSGSCVNTPIPESTCDDHDVCTDDGCAPRAGCTHLFNTAPCSDGLYCTSSDYCADGECAGESRAVCPSGCVCNEAEDICEAVRPDVICPVL